MTSTVPCPHCKQPLDLEVPDDLRGTPAIVTANLMKLAVHDGCAEKLRAEAESKQAALALAGRQKVWESVCPTAYLATDEAKLPNQEASRKALEWTPENPERKGLILHSNGSGTGKTRTAFLILHRQFVRENRSFMVTTHTQFARDVIQLQFDPNPNVLREWLDKLRKASILLIDDLGKSKATTADGQGGKAEEALFDLLDARFSEMRPIIFTTNFRGQELERKFSSDRGPYLLRRLREFCVSVHFGRSNEKAQR